MRYYVLCSGYVCMLSLFSDGPVPLEDAQLAVDEGNKLNPHLRYFLVDEERYNRWWREYLNGSS
jgi:hypothetical protein